MMGSDVDVSEVAAMYRIRALVAALALCAVGGIAGTPAPLQAQGSCAGRGGNADADALCDDVDPCPAWANADPAGDPNSDGIPTECQCGDANQDGFLTLGDAGEVAQKAGEQDVSIADTNNDGRLDVADASAIAEAASGSRPAYALTCARRPSGTAPPQ